MSKKQRRKTWYTLEVFRGHEWKIKDKLMDNPTTKDLIDEIYIPTQKVHEIKDGQKKAKEKRLLPGYLLVSLNDDNEALIKEAVREIERVDKVIRFLKSQSEGVPQSLSKVEVNNLFGREEESKSKEDKWMEGEEVKIVDGPFSDFKGTINEIKSNNRLQILVKVFDKTTPVEVKKTQVEEIN